MSQTAKIRTFADIAKCDIIRSSSFQFGQRTYPEDPISVGLSGRYENQTFRDVDTVVEGHPTTVQVPNDPFMLDKSDSARASALFFVETVEKSSEGMIGMDRSVRVEARRLNDDGTYDPSNELIEFRMNGSFGNTIAEVELVGHGVVSVAANLF